MTRSRNHLIATLLTLALVGAAGCGGDDDNGPIPPAFIDQTLADDIAQHVGMTLATDNGGWVYGFTAQAATVPLSLASVRARLARAGGVLRDTSFVVNGITWTVADSFFNAAGDFSEDYDPATSTRMSLASFGNGDMIVSGSSFRAAFHHRIWVVATNLSSTQSTLYFNGTSRDSSRSWFTSQIGTAAGASRRLLCYGNFEWDSVGTVKSQAPDTPPKDGIATGTFNAFRFSNADTTQVEKQASAVTVLIAFDGSAQVTLNVDGHYEYFVNLHTGAVTKQ